MRRIGSVLLAITASAGIIACGSSSSSDSSGASGKAGGSITIGTVGPDSYDPALFQTTQAVEALHPVYTGLTTYAAKQGKAGGVVIPGLAESLPKLSNGNKTYTFTLRKGLKYSNGTPLKAADFEHAVKRIVSLKGAYSSFFTGIVGAAEYQKKGDKNADISGITSNEKKRQIVIKLMAPDSKFLFALSEPYVAPVPSSTPIKDMTGNPPPGIGPYTLKVVDPSRKFVLTKDKNFASFKIPGVPVGKVDKITGEITSVPRMTQNVISGSMDFMTEDPTGDLLPQVRQKYGDRIRLDANPPNTYYFFLNTSIAPFNKLEARQAVNYAIDSRALVRIFGGRLQPGCTFLPPGLPGYKKYDCPYGNPNGPGNITKAKQLVQQSGTKGQPVTVWTNNKDPRPAIAQYYTDVLNQIGFKAKTKTLDQQVYFDRVGTKSTKAQTGFTDWFQDFPNPADFFQPLLSKESLQSTPTSNQGQVNDATLSDKIQKLTEAPKVDKVAGQWGDLDKYVVKDKAYLVPYGYEKSSSFFSERMNFKDCAGVHAVWKNDWTQFCLK